MKIRLISDIHAEFGRFDLPVLEGEDQDVLVIAGDFGLVSRQSTTIDPYLKEYSERFRDVIYVTGNHEAYKTSVLRVHDKIKDGLKYEDIQNVHVLNNGIIRIDNVTFIGSTMWASFDKGDPMCMYASEFTMNDHKLIRTGTSKAPYLKKFKPSDAYEHFLTAINFIFPMIEQEKQKDRKVCVVTHHAPSVLSIPNEFKTGAYSDVNGAYASSLEEDIFDTKPDVWVHGHIHQSQDYILGDTRIMCNPRGYYPNGLNSEFNPNLVISLD